MAYYRHFLLYIAYLYKSVEKLHDAFSSIIIFEKRK